MRCLSIAVLTVAWLAAPLPARAQSWEVSGLAGYTPSADLERRAPQLTDLAIRSGFTWGVQASRALTSAWAVEALWMQQASALEAGTLAGTADLFTMSVSQLQGNAVYHLGRPDSRLRPFLFAGLGATFFRADGLESETKLSFGLGGGIKYFAWTNLGIRGHFRYKPTMLDDEEAGDFCDPFGFCQRTLNQIEVAAAVIVRF
jgi:opacity protein-like surface antigen